MRIRRSGTGTGGGACAHDRADPERAYANHCRTDLHAGWKEEGKPGDSYADASPRDLDPRPSSER